MAMLRGGVSMQAVHPRLRALPGTPTGPETNAKSPFQLLLAGAAFVWLVSSLSAGVSPVRVGAVAVVLVLAPWFATRQRVWSTPLTSMAIASCVGTLLFLPTGMPGALAQVVTLSSGAIFGSYVVRRSPARALLGVSSTIAAFQWPLIATQFLDPSQVLRRRAALGHLPAKEEIAVLRPIGNTVTAGLVAVFLLLGFATALILLVRLKRHRLLAWCLCTGHLGAILATGSRSALLATAVFVAVLAARSGRRVLGTMLPPALLYAVVEISREQSRVDLTSRLEFLRLAANDVGSSWATGVGWGQTPYRLTTLQDGVIYHLHFLPAHILYECGVFGALALAFACLAAAKVSWRATLVLLPFASLDAGVFLEPRTAFMTMTLGAVIAHAAPNRRQI